MTSIIPPATERSGGLPFRYSILARILAALILAIALVGAALFLGIDHFVSRQFHALHDERSQRLAQDIQRSAQEELLRLEGLARLLAEDKDLNQAAFYHLHLEGEKDHPQAAVARIVAAFRLGSAALAAPDGRLVVVAGKAALPLPRGKTEAFSAVAWSGEGARMLAGAPLRRDGQILAWLMLTLPLEDLHARHRLDSQEAVVRPRRQATAGVPAVALPDLGEPVLLEIRLPDTAGRALAQVKQLLVAILALAGVLLAAGFGLYLRRELRPLSALTAATADVGRGEFGRSLPERGHHEIARLVRAFNLMTRDLSRLRELERRLRHQEQLSAIGRVAARVAHDINNPLSVIGNVARLLARQLADPAQKQDAELIVHHGERCQRTVENLLEFGRPIKPHLAELAPADLLAGIVERWRGRTGDTPVALAIAETLPALRADPLLLEQMIDNLLDNAREAAPGGEIRIELAGEPNGLRLTITDAGPGFPEAARTHLFEPFHTTKRGGTGLGLASSLAVARAHGGDLEIPPGAPGRVVVTMPVGGISADNPLPPRSPG